MSWIDLGRCAGLAGVAGLRVRVCADPASGGVLVLGGPGGSGRRQLVRLASQAVAGGDGSPPAVLVVARDPDPGFEPTPASAGSDRPLHRLDFGCDPPVWNPLDLPFLGSLALAERVLGAEQVAAGAPFAPAERRLALHMLRWLFHLWRHLPEPRITFEQLRDLLAEPDPLQTLFDRYMDYLFSRYRYRVEVHEDDYERFRARLDRVVIGEADVALSRAMQVEPFLHDDMLGPGGACREYVFSWHLYRGRYHTLVDGLPYTALAWALRGGSPAGSAAAGSGDAASVPYADYVLEEPEADVGASADAAHHWRRRCWRTALRRRRSAVLRRLVDFAGLFTVAPFRAALCPPSPDLSGAQPVVLDSVDLLVRGGAAVVLDLSSLGRSPEAAALGWMMKRAWLDAASLPRPLPRRTALLVAYSYEDLVAGRQDAAADAAAFSGADGSAAVPFVRAGSARRLEAVAGRSGLSMLVDAAGAVLVLGGAGWARRLARLLLPGACADRVAACAARLGSLSGAGALARVGPSTLVRLTVFTEDLSDPGSRTGRLRRLAGGFMDAVSRLCSRRRGAVTLSRADSG